MIRLGVNVDHVATVRQARRAAVPDPVEAALVAEKAGADGITVHMREELTTEGGLDVVAHRTKIKESIIRLQDRGIHVSLFIDPEGAQIEAAREVGAYAVEIHTGSYRNVTGIEREKERRAITKAATLAQTLGLEVHAGHGLDYGNVAPIAEIPEIIELNIGHSIIARAVIVGMEQAVREMKELLARARA